jgi:DinB family protein
VPRSSESLRRHVVELLKGKNAHVDLEGALADFPPKLRGIKPKGAPHSAWQLLEHIRIAQWDILEFSRNPKHVSPTWPHEYWPKTVAPPSAAAWNKSVREVRADLKAMEQLVQSKQSDLSRRIPHGEGQTLLREALLLADHNAYHVGQLVLLRRLLRAWSPR